MSINVKSVERPLNNWSFTLMGIHRFRVPLVVMGILTGLCLRSHVVRAALVKCLKALHLPQVAPHPVVFPEPPRYITAVSFVINNFNMLGL